jgi:hypothetical protein
MNPFSKWWAGISGKERRTEQTEALATISPQSSSGNPKKIYQADAALADPALDVFDRAPFAARIAETIGERSDPSSLVIGIYGPWGDGKTTVLNFIRARLAAYPSIICIPFNPWRVEGEQALLEGFFTTLAEVLDEELTTSSEKLGDVLKRYGALLKVLPGGWGDAATGAGNVLSSTSIDDLRGRVSAILRESGRRVVVIMDDIDRLDRTEIQAIFRLVKLTGDFENTAYVLAFDERMVAGAVGEKYASGSGNAYEAGLNFLEKIVQVPLHLPPPSDDALRQYCFGLVDEALRDSGTEMTQNQVNEFVRHFIDGLRVRLKTPRMAKRYANALHFALTILKGESYTPDLLLIEGMRVFYPQLYDAIRHDQETVLRTSSADRPNAGLDQFINTHTEGMTAEERQTASNLVQAIFPRTGRTILGSDWESEFAKDQRISSNYYFSRYFTYGVSASDVPDIPLKAFIASLPNTPIEDSVTALRAIVNGRNASTLLYKLRNVENEIPLEAAGRLAQVLALTAACYPAPESFVFFQTPQKQAAICISQLLRRLSSEVRTPIAMRVVEHAETVLFACECARWLGAGDGSMEAVLDTESEKQMQRILGERIRVFIESDERPIQQRDPKNTGTYLGWWETCSGPEPVRAYLSKQITANPAAVFDLIKACLPAGWGMTTGLPIETSFDRNTYNAIIRLIDPAIIAQAMKTLYRDELDSPQYHMSNREPRERRLAHQFMVVHNRVLAGQPVNNSEVPEGQEQ